MDYRIWDRVARRRGLMRSRKFILSAAVALALGTLPALASTPKGSAATRSATSDNKGKDSRTETKKIEATVVSMTADTLVVRAGKRDEVFKIDSLTRKAQGISAGNKVTVNYRKDSGKYVATDIELSATN
jgi:hypothetical protein